jgi:hypothetical protein
MCMIAAVWEAIKASAWISFSLIYGIIRCSVTGAEEGPLVGNHWT